MISGVVIGHSPPLVTVVVPSYNQGRYLNQALTSIFEQGVPVEVFVMDGGSKDNSLEVILKWAPRLAGWVSAPDGGQAAAINAGMAKGCAPFVCWLNSDDWLLPNGLRNLLDALNASPNSPMVYGKTFDFLHNNGKMRNALVLPFSAWLMARVCVISQPGTLVRRSCWEAVAGLDTSLHMAMDYDLWWRIYKACGKPRMVPNIVAVNRVHDATKTNTRRHQHYKEAITVVGRHYGKAPWKWWLTQPYTVWWRAFKGRFTDQSK